MPIYIEHDYYPADVLTDCDAAGALYRGPIREIPTPGIEREKTEVRDLAGPYSEN